MPPELASTRHMRAAYARSMKLALTLVVALTGTAAAEPAAPSYTELSLPLVLGGTSVDGGGAAVGIRPELVVARNAPGGGVGLGGYGELMTLNGHREVGAGLTIARYRRRRYGVASSIGMYTGAKSGVSAGMFVGLRHPTEQHIEMPIGVRVDGHFEPDKAADVIIAAQVDLVPIGVLGLALAQVFHMRD
jgi:hypothetical protein